MEAIEHEFIAPDFVNNSNPDTIHERMMNNLPANISNMPGDIPYDFTMPTAIEVSQLIQFDIVRTIMIMSPLWAWGMWLDLHGAREKVPRKAATRATGTVTVTAVPGTEIPVGFVFCTEGIDERKSIEFITRENVTVQEDGKMDIEVEAAIPGALSNVTSGVVILQKKINKAIISVTNNNEIKGGTDIEEDEPYRERIIDKMRSADLSAVGCDSDYERWAKEVPGVYSAAVAAEWDGPGTVKVVVVGNDGTSVSESVIRDVENHIVSEHDRSKRICPIGATVTIATSEGITITYSAVLELEGGYTIEVISVLYREALSEYYKKAKEDGEIRYSKAHSELSNIPGVKDFKEFKICSGTDNIPISVDSYPFTALADIIFTEGTV